MNNIREGDLYKVIKIDDITLEIKYGYYEEKDRYSKYNDPIPIFPDFIKNPMYTKGGNLIVTHMQEQCDHFESKINEGECFNCKHFKLWEDLIGICTCAFNRRSSEKNYF